MADYKPVNNRTLADINKANRQVSRGNFRTLSRDEFKLSRAEIDRRLQELSQRLKQAESLAPGTPGREWKIETIKIEIGRLQEARKTSS
jgi:septation ring formation regulator EzrA